MAIHAVVLALAMQISPLPANFPAAPGIWSPPQSTPMPSRTQIEATENSIKVSDRIASLRQEVRAELRSGEISPAEARELRRDLAAIGCSWETGAGDGDQLSTLNRLDALGSLIYAAGATISPK